MNMKKLIFIITGVVVLLILGLVIYNKAFKSTISIPTKTDVNRTKILPTSISPTATATSAKTIQPTIDQQPKPITNESGGSINALISRIEGWKKKYPDLFKEYPELEELLRNLEAKKAIDLLLQSRFAGTAAEIIIYSLNYLKGPDIQNYWDILQILKPKVSKDDIPEIIKLLSDSDARVRKGAIWVLGKSQAKEAVPEIIRLLSDSDAGVRRIAINALWELQAKETIPEAIKLLSDSDAEVRGSAIWVLGD
ncbi:MAG: HEAT repeat domain-containing protein [Planctomycetota bacterium]